MTYFDIKISQLPDYSVIALIGQADMLVAEKLDRVFNNIMKTPDVNIIVDLKELNFICSIALSCLIRAHRECKKNNGNLILTGLPDIILKLLQTTQLDTFFKLCDSVEQATDDLFK